MYPEAEVVLTLGEKGCAYSYKKQRIYQKSYPVSAVDTTGAGDTFTGYYLACSLENMNIRDCLEYASRAAAIAVTEREQPPQFRGDRKWKLLKKKRQSEAGQRGQTHG